MENRINNRDFEQFVKQNADQYRMFPSEKVWDGIHSRLHKRRRWLGTGIALLLLSIGTATWIMVANNKNANTEKIVATNTETYKPEKDITNNKYSVPAVIQAPVAASSNIRVSETRRVQRRINSVSLFDITEKDVAVSLPEQDETIADSNAPPTVNQPEVATADIAVIETNSNKTPAIEKPNELVNKNETIIKSVVEPAVVEPVTTMKEISAEKETDLTSGQNTSFNNELLTIESVVNSYVRIKKREKTSLQAYFTPLVTYRSLHENKSFINSARNISNSAQGTTQYIYYMPDLKNVVMHKPDIGFNLGIAAGIPVTKNFRLLSGLQFNVNKYDIRAYQYTNEVAPVALSTDNGGTNTVYPVTSYRIVGGYNTKWLRNYYFSASVPVGAEIKLINNKKASFGISGTLQPTYVLDNRSYLISTDYKNYVEIPSLTRRWNINTGLEVFAGVKTGRMEWRVSPQVRYQTLSSYKNAYPVKENLFDFGLKLGVMLK